MLQAKPNTHPGGVHGAFKRDKYHSDGTPSDVKRPPNAKAVKFSIKNIVVLKITF
tara:strand:- start:747 stop:911 length:165 start_codon:yes stop_codon:yes gene_type:complete